MFRDISVVICKPDLAQLHCPPSFYISPPSVDMLTSTEPDVQSGNVSPSCYRKNGKFLQPTGGKSCLKENRNKVIRHLCEGTTKCQIPAGQLLINTTECANLQAPIQISYKCLPDPETALSEIICADTYMEVKCDAQPSEKVLVIYAAVLRKRITRVTQEHTSCPAIEGDVTLGFNEFDCVHGVDITDSIWDSCSGQSSCSISPNMAKQREELLKKCGKMHLSLTYGCVPTEMTRKPPERPVANMDKINAKRKKNQRQPKEVHDAKLQVSLNRPSAKMTGSEPREKPSLNHQPSDQPKQPEPVHRRENTGNVDLPGGKTELDERIASISNTGGGLELTPSKGVQTISIGLGVGLGVLTVLLIVLFLGCRKRRRFTAHRKLFNISFTESDNRQNKAGHVCNLHGKTAANTQTPTMACPSPWIKSHQCGCLGCQSLAGTSCTDELSPNPAAAQPAEKCLLTAEPVVCGLMHANCHPSRTSYCTSVSSTCTIPHGLQPFDPMGGPTGSGRTSEELLLTSANLQFMTGFQHGEMPVTPSHMRGLDERSVGQSNSSSSGIGGMNLHYPHSGSHFPSPELLKESQQRANAESVNPLPGCLVQRVASVTGSSTGRGCDGGSGSSDPGEQFSMNPPRLKQVTSEQPEPADELFMGLSSVQYHNTVYDPLSPHAVPQFTDEQHKMFSAVPPSKYLFGPAKPYLQDNYNQGSSVMGLRSHHLSSASQRAPDFGIDNQATLNPSQEPASPIGLQDVFEISQYSDKKFRQGVSCLAARNCDTNLREEQSEESQNQTATSDDDSSESFTAPVLEPPSDFRSPAKTSNTTDESVYKKNGVSGNPADAIKTTCSSVPKVDIDSPDDEQEVEQPPPQMPPLRVLTSSHVSECVNNNPRSFYTIR
ncbi:unnamed protein product [Calicophoron daubneyi]|uniref:SUEL-type lectin domain-containing protein n=1 Tax=Calicophoron daubneyi TaxID=300641 RepID=A0AAV2TQU0_CALDB